MDSLAGLSRQLKSVASLGNLVKTLKVLSAVNQRIFSKSCEALDAYLQNIESGLQVVLRQLPHPSADCAGQGILRLVILGSDHGLCGAFHTHLLLSLEPSSSHSEVICVGARLAEAARDQGIKVDHVLSAPTSTAGLADVTGELLQRLQPMDGGVTLLYHHGQDGPSQENLWPVQEDWLNQLRQRRWLARGERGGLPGCWGDPSLALEWLLEEYVHSSCQRALAHSLASENQARLQTMQAAEKNLEELRLELQEGLQSRRQNAVTEELLDLIAGFEILKEDLH